jgi:hypothetical protein
VIDRAKDPLAARADGADPNHALPDPDRAGRVRLERAIPALRLERPRPDEDAAVRDDRPDADEPVLLPRANLEVLGLVQRADEPGREAFDGGHGRVPG